MSEKPIMFCTSMVQAIMRGDKTQTRRVIKHLRRLEKHGGPILDGHVVGKKGDVGNPLGFMTGCGIERPTYHQGDILWVRETWSSGHEVNTGNLAFLYKADGSTSSKWHPSIHMPRVAARIFLRVTDVRVERVQEISEADARAEGIASYWAEPHKEDPPFIGTAKKVGAELCFTRREAFRQLWDSLNAKRGYGWDMNPWVWVYDFTRHESISAI